MAKGFKVNKEFDDEMKKMSGTEYSRKPMKNEVCVTVEQDVASFLRGLAVGKSLDIIKIEEDIDAPTFDFLEPTKYKVCGSRIDMLAALGNVDSKSNCLDRACKPFKQARKKLMKALKIKNPQS